VPQIVYYFSAYCDLLNDEQITYGEEVNFVVPTGNFGNILAGYYAKRMGLPVGQLICASNSNKVLTDFFAQGVYDKNRELVLTTSPSMDILVSSNLERLIYHIGGNDPDYISGRMQLLQQEGAYDVDGLIAYTMRKFFWADHATEEQTAECIRNVFDTYGYLLDPHTAVGVKACRQYLARSGDSRKTVVLSTASPYKFSQTVLEALLGEKQQLSDAEAMLKLSELSGTKIPTPLAELFSCRERFTGSCGKQELVQTVVDFLQKKTAATAE